ncbi:hypothetical protein Q7P37_009571 [Cladosporium fusiforme]
MAFNFGGADSSSENEDMADISAWQTGTVRKRSTPQRRTSGFQAVNHPAAEDAEDIAMQSSPEPIAAPVPLPAPVAQMVPGTEPTVISSGEESSSEDEEDEPNATAPLRLEEVEDLNVAPSLINIVESPVAEEQEYQEEKVISEAGHRSDQLSSRSHEQSLEPWPVQDDELYVPPSTLEVFIPRDELNEEEREEYEDFTAGGNVVLRVLNELRDEDGMMEYKVEFEDLHIEQISFADLFLYQNGQEALNSFESEPSPEPKPEPNPRRSSGRMSSTRPGARSSRQSGFVSTVDAIDLSEPELVSEEDEPLHARRSGRKRQQDNSQYFGAPDSEESDDFAATDVSSRRRSKKDIAPSRKSLRRSSRAALDDSDRDLIAGDYSEDEDDYDDDDDDGYLLKSDLPGARKRGRPHGARKGSGGNDRLKRQRAGERHSARTTRHLGGMEEIDIDNIYRSESVEAQRAPPKPKPIAAKEIFKPLPRNDEFRIRHSQQCEVCTNGPNFAPLIYCQGCTLSYHKQCLGHRTNREHLVTKIGEGDFVLQCRRCIAVPYKKDPSAPDQGKCQDCYRHGAACRPFRHRKTPAQEQREREENDGIDPAYEVDPERINNSENVLFRCINCFRAFHFEHLPSRSDLMELDTEADAEQRFREYSRDGKCKECLNIPAKVSGLIAWKPTDEDNYDDAMAIDEINDDEKAYLVRWEGQSYFQACWMPGAWVWGVTNASMRKAFAKRDDAQRPKMRTEEAIPEDFLRTDIVLDIKFTSIVDIRTEVIDKARIREVDKALIKYKGLGYEDAVWEKPPTPEDWERWTDFVTAYNDWVLGRYVRPPARSALKTRLEKARKVNFDDLEKKTQPETIQGGELMKYQLEGLNWLYYKWHTQKNAILADEMGLGKTIQIIGFLATLVEDWTCFPFLIVVPNSTCPNWRREIKRWAPGLRVVAFYGSKESRDLAYRHEMFPESSKDLRCHVVVTSYDAAADDSCRKFFRSVQWQGLIVDEGQRLKSEKTQLYSALGALRAPFKVLMTGTPLQNNQRELFNLLHFLDESKDVDELEKKYEDLDQAKITELHEEIRPFFLRRTKAQVLTFLPPMAQIILPVSMSVLQKKVYRTILAKNPELMRSIFSPEQNLGKGERASLSNVLMQLRKCLCHPFVYSRGIEERHHDTSLSHRNLVDASSKLKLLELLLPKLQERGHRVLIFSQFLDMLDMVEDFLDGMSLQYQRLDGQIGSLQKQKRIDDFNAPDSPLFAFLLSTRAGGVGINLATADTVIILDPDFNPHQDIQALSRAHRIGQTKKVLCFQLVTRASAEEKVMQIGRKKLALDHVLIQEMDADDTEENDLVSVLRHGAGELFEDNGDQDIVYDSFGIEQLLDRSHIEDTNSGADASAETQFSHARVWANNTGGLEDVALEDSEESAPDPGVWANILKERERAANEEAAAKAEALGRGRRNRGHIDYAGDIMAEAEGLDISPVKKKGGRKNKDPDESDTDFQADSDAESGAEEGENADTDMLDKDDLGIAKRDAAGKKSGKRNSSSQPSPLAPAATPTKGGRKAANVNTTPKASLSTKKPTGVSKTTAKPRKVSYFVRRTTNMVGGKAAPKSKAVSTPVARPKKATTKQAPVKRAPSSLTSTLKKTKAGAPPKSQAKETTGSQGNASTLSAEAPPTFRRAHVPQAASPDGTATPNDNDTQNGKIAIPTADDYIKCVVCRTKHLLGSCPLKVAGVEYCNLCGIAHYGQTRVCPHITSETQVRAMLEALKSSNEPEHLVREATRYLKGLKGNLVQIKKQKMAKEHAAREEAAAAAFQQQQNFYQQQQQPYGQPQPSGQPSFRQPPGPSGGGGPGFYYL